MASYYNAQYNLYTLLISIAFLHTSEAIKCYDCNSANNSACLDLHLQRFHKVVPVVDCGKAIPNAISKDFFCRKMTQTILHADKSPEVRVTRSCGWVRHKRECYTADNKDHLETVCQCFGDMCNSAPTMFSNMKAGFYVFAIILSARLKNNFL